MGGMKRNFTRRLFIFLTAYALAFTAVFCVCLFSGAQRAAFAYVTVEKHPIDIAMQKKLDEDSSTAGILDAYEFAMKEWDKLLNENYKGLMQKLTKEEQEELRASQLAWIKYRDLEFAFNKGFWGKFKGTMYIPFSPGYQVHFVRERALRLGYYLEDVKAQE